MACDIGSRVVCVTATRGELGYVVTDVPGVLSDEVLAALEAMPETVCLRQLG